MKWWSLYSAIRENNIDFVKHELEQFPELANEKGSGMCQHSFLIHIAANENRSEICKLLVNKMCHENLCIQDTLGRTPLYYSAKNGNLELSIIFFQLAPKSIFKTDCLGRTVFICAARKSCEEICLFFIGHVDEDYINHRENLHNGYTLLEYAAKHNLLKVVQTILELYPILISDVNPVYKKTLLHIAAEYGHTELSKFLLEKFPMLADFKTCYKDTALSISIRHGQFETFKFLLDNHPYSLKTVVNLYGLPTSLSFEKNKLADIKAFNIISTKCADIISSIIIINNKYIVSLDCIDNIKNWDCILGIHPELISRLTFDNTLLHLAAQNGHTKICEYLIKKYPYLTNIKIGIFNQTPLSLTIENTHFENCKFLLDLTSSENINKLYFDGNTLLQIAITKCIFNVCELLISRMSYNAINHTNNDGKTALDLLKNLPYNSFKYSSCQNECDYNKNYNVILSLLQEHMTINGEKPAQQIYKVQNCEITGEISTDFQ